MKVETITLLTLILIFFGQTACIGGELWVPRDYPTIQSGIDAAIDGDTVIIEDGTYYGEGNRDIDFFGKTITVRSENGPESCVIDCMGGCAPDERHFGFQLVSGEGDGTVLEGFTISRPTKTGILCEGGSSQIPLSPQIKTCIVTGNSHGNGITSRSTGAIITDCIIEKNSSGSGGGGILASGSTVIRNSIIRWNFTYGGGGGIHAFDQVRIENCEIYGNISWVGSGGISIGNHSSVVVSNCTIRNNSADIDYEANGGGIGLSLGENLIVNCIIADNNANQSGGIDSWQYDNSVFINCLITGNVAGYYLENDDHTSFGGGVFSSYGSHPVMIHCTIAGNYAEEGGGIATFSSGRVSFEDGILWENTGKQIYNSPSGHAFVIGSDVQGGYRGENNFDEDPLFVQGAGGGYCLSERAAGQKVDSPCLDASDDRASAICFPAGENHVCLSDLSTRSDWLRDIGFANIGAHFDPERPLPSPTPLPEGTGIRLEMPKTYFSPGDEFWLTAYLEHNGVTVMRRRSIFIALEAYGSYYFWPSWTRFTPPSDGGIDQRYLDVYFGSRMVRAIEPFEWPDTGDEISPELTFYGFMGDIGLTMLQGDMSVITWGYGPAGIGSPTPTASPAPSPTPAPAPEGFALIPAGSFTMGSSPFESGNYTANTETQHLVTLTRPFYLKRIELTQAEWMEVFDVNPSWFTGDDLPVEQITWNDALIYCNRISIEEGFRPCYYVDPEYHEVFDGTPPVKDRNFVYWDMTADGYRLPTEAEWEYACRAGTTTAFNDGVVIDDAVNYLGADLLAWSNQNSDWRSHEVGQKRPNAWGLYDMHGNIMEWCWDNAADSIEDRYDAYAQTDPAGPFAYSNEWNKRARGGSFHYPRDWCRSAKRGGGDIIVELSDHGVRIARNAE